MSDTSPGIRHRRRIGARRRALSLVELMISLAITASLLTAVAAAFSAAASATEANDRHFRATQAGRVALHQLLSEIRQCDTVTVPNTFDRMIVEVPGERLQDNEDYRTFFFKPPTATVPGSLRFHWTNKSAVITPDANGWRMCNNVTGQFRPDIRTDTDPVTGNPVQTVVRVAVVLIVTIDGQKIELSGSAAPRRAMLY
jgi:type II secretory pathway pseudopilin PulG